MDFSNQIISHISYSGGRYQEDHGSKRPYLENTQHKKGLVEWLKV
jgi:hypothetical protein